MTTFTVHFGSHKPKARALALLILALVNFVTVSGKISWDCSGGIKYIFEDHEPNETQPIITITADSDDDFTITYPEPINHTTQGSETVVYLTRSIKNEKHPDGFMVMLMPKAMSCLIFPRPVNLHPPVFVNSINKEKIKENLKDLYTFYVSVVDDQDLRRDGDMDTLDIKMIGTDASPDLFELMQTQDSGNKSYTVGIKVKTGLDFEEKRLHRLEISVKDKSENRDNPVPVHTDSISIDVEVEDVHDQEPKFSSECGVRNIEEHTKEDVLVTTVKAMDGDTQLNNFFKYTFSSASTGDKSVDRIDIVKKYFKINEETGQVTIKKEPDRESDDFLEDSTIFFDINATELVNPTKEEEKPPNTVLTTCYFHITDIDDHPPAFDRKTYEVTVDEHSPTNYPLPFEPPPFVVDKDMGVNATFTLTLKGEGSELFSLIPKDGQNNVSFAIRVQDSKKLDYESPEIPDHRLTFEIEAVGKVNNTFIATSKITVNINDTNDNPPEFDSTPYEVTLNENVTIGQSVLTVMANDIDTGIFGVQGIRYSILTNQENFEIDDVTGNITVKKGHGIDREVQEDLYLTVQAADELGKGHSVQAQVHIKVEDANDEKPYFLILNYKTILYENEKNTEAEIQVQARDNDAPNTANSEVNYKLKTYTDFFRVDVASGMLSLNQPLDFEKDDPKFPSIFNEKDRVWKRIFNLEIQAYDLGDPRQVSEKNAIVIIDFVDVNDNIPVFSETSLHTTINETIQRGEKLRLVLNATDSDLSRDYNQVYYNFHGEPHSSFLVDRKTGELKISPSPLLAPEENGYKENHTLWVEATDGLQNAEENNLCQVTVTVLDVNNQKPEFAKTDVIKNKVEEEQEFNDILAVFNASDKDTDHDLIYTIDYKNSRAEAPNRTAVSLDNEQYKKCFVIDPKNGSLTVFKVDREQVKIVDLLIMVEDVNGEINTPQTATENFKLEVLDINDNDPIFLNANDDGGYNASIPENRQEKQFLKIDAMDVDEFNKITYTLKLDTSKYNVNASINSQSGVVDFGPVDYEEHHSVIFTVHATDNDQISTRISNATVIVAVEDENDNKPEFNKSANYTVEIDENVAIGYFIIQLSATDKDSGQFGLVHYRISDNSIGENSKYFQILNPEEGNVTIRESPDYEKLSSKELVVTMEAFDNPEAFVNNQHVTFESLRVVVRDVNDNEPIFTEKLDCFKVSEDIQTYLEFGKVEAKDNDAPETNNSFVEYEILEVYKPIHLTAEGKDFFHLNLITGTLHANKSLLHIPKKDTDPTFHLTLRAKDRGIPPMNSTGEFCIFVEDINNERPTFITPNPSDGAIKKSVHETSPLSTKVIQVQADDHDWDEHNHKVTYSFGDSTSSDAKKHFKLDTVTGLISTNHKLKQDEISEYDIVVQACDNPRDNSKRLCTTEEESVKIIILVKSEKDEKPKFHNRTNQELHFTEHKEPGNETQLVPEAKFDDIVENPQPICYFIIGGDSKEFDLDKETRILTVKGDLDREEHSHRKIIVKATEDCENKPTVNDVSEALKGLDTVNITIRLIDINDNPPRFDSNYTAGISSSSKTLGETLKTRLNATDLDEGENAVFWYEMDGAVEITGENMEALRHQVVQNDQQPFSVNNMTGEIKINFSADKNMKGHFKFDVKAIDTGKLEGKAFVLVYLMREDQQIVVHVRKPLADINEAFLSSFTSAVRDVTRYAFNVDNYMAYTGPKQDLLKDSSSTLWAHLVNTTTNQVLDSKESLKVINLHYSDLVLRTQAAGGSLIGADEKIEEVETPPKDYMLILLVASIGCLFIALSLTCGIFVYKMRSSNRKLKAARAVTYEKDDEAINTLAMPAAPNTNAHTLKGSNPIWTDNDVGQGNITLDNTITFDSGFDTDSVSSIVGLEELQDFEPTGNPLFQEDEDTMDGVLNQGFDPEEGPTEKPSGKGSQALTKFDTISNLKRAEEQWRQKKKEAPKPPSTNQNEPFKFNTTRKKMDYFPGYEEESDL